MTLKDLRAEAKRLDIPGRSKMNQEQLVEALKANEMARRENDKRVAVLTPTVGPTLIMRTNPSEEEVQGFVKVNNARAEVGEVNHDGYPVVRVLEAVYYEDEQSYLRGDVDSQGEEIDLSDVL
jgi:hypothetical protein